MVDKAKLVSKGPSQTVRLPAKYHFKGEEVYIRRDAETGDVIPSAKPQDWSAFIALLDPTDPDIQTFLSDRKDPPPPERDLF